MAVGCLVVVGVVDIKRSGEDMDPLRREGDTKGFKPIIVAASASATASVSVSLCMMVMAEVEA